MNVLGLHFTRRTLILAAVLFFAVTLYRRRGGRGFPNMTLRQRAEP